MTLSGATDDLTCLDRREHFTSATQGLCGREKATTCPALRRLVSAVLQSLVRLDNHVSNPHVV